jgi:hypothetical protein
LKIIYIPRKLYQNIPNDFKTHHPAVTTTKIQKYQPEKNQNTEHEDQTRGK